MAKKDYEKLCDFFDKKIRKSHAEKNFNLKQFLEDTEEIFQREGFRKNISATVKNILIVRLDVVGDFILTSGFIREVRKNFPQANITLVVSRLVYSIAERCPYVNEVLVFEKNAGKTFQDFLKHEINFCRENLWSKHYSVAFSPQFGSDNLAALFLCYLSGAKERIGYGKYPYAAWFGVPKEQKLTVELDNIFLTQNITVPKEFITEADHHFYLLHAAGLKLYGLNMELWFDSEDFLKAEKLLQEISSDKRKIAIGLGAGSESRKYPVKKLIAALTEIAKKNFVFVVIGGNGESEDAHYLEKNLPQGTVLNFVGKTTLCETEAVISQMDFYIGNDTGVMHMAAASDVPVLAIYREAEDKITEDNPLVSEYLRFPPWQTKAVILRPEHALDDCANTIVYGGCCHEEAHCITQIEPQEIILGFERLLELVTEK